MGVVLLLVFLPVLASIACVVGVIAVDGSAGSVIGGLAFLALAGGVFVGMLNTARHWDAG